MMRRISSKWTLFYKRIFPTFWFGFLSLFIVFWFFTMARSGRLPPVGLLIEPVILMLFGLVLMKMLIFDLADEVWEESESLLVKSRGQEQRIAFADVKNVNYTTLTGPRRVTLALRRPTVFGDEITFCAPVRFVPFAKSPMIAQLIDRIDLARRKNA